MKQARDVTILQYQYIEVQAKLKGMSQERACPKNLEGHFQRAGLSLELRRACRQSALVQRMLKGMSQERAGPKHFKGHVPRAGMYQTF